MAKKRTKQVPSTKKPTAQQTSSQQGNDESKQTQISDLLKRRKELESEILAIKKQILTEDKNDAEQLDKINRFEIKRNKHIKEYYEVSEKISKLRKDELDNLIKIEKLEKEKEKRQKEEEKKIKSIEEHTEEIYELQEKSLVLMRSMSEQTQKQAQQMGLTASNVRALTDEIKDANLSISNSVEVSKSFDKNLTSAMNIAKELDSIEGKMAEGIENLADKEYEMLDLYETERKLKMAMAQLDVNASKMGAERYVMLRKTLETYSAQLKRIQSVNKGLSDQSKLLNASKRAAASGSQSTSKITEDNNREMTKAGESQANAFNRAMSRGMNKAGGWVDTLVTKIKNGMMWAVDKIKNGIKSVLGFIWDMITKVFSLFFDAIFDADKRLAEISKTFGVNRQTAFDLEKSFANMALSMNLIGINSTQIRETAEYMVEEFGVDVNTLVNKSVSTGVLQNMTILRESFQATNEEARSFLELSVITGKSMDELAFTVDKMSKGIMSNKTAFKALASIPNAMRINLKGSVAEMANFAMKVKLMGLDFNKIGQMQEGFLDIESSLEKQFEAQVLTGIHIGDMDKIRAASLYGETDKMFDLIMKNIGSLDRFKNMKSGIYGQKKLAEALQMTREELADLLTRGETLKKLGLSFQQASKYGEKSIKELRALAEQQRKTGNVALANYFQDLAQEKQNVELMTQFDDKMEKLKMQFLPAAIKILEILHKVMDAFYNSKLLNKMVEWANKSILTIVTNLEKFFNGEIGFKDLFSGIDFSGMFKDLFNDPAIKEFSKSLGLDKVKEGLEGIVKELGKLNEKLGIVSWLTDNWGKLLGIVATLILTKFITGSGIFKLAAGVAVLAGGMYFLTDSMQKLAVLDAGNLWAVAGAMGAMVGGLVLLGAITTASGGTVALGIIAVVASFRLLVGAMVALAEVADKLKPVFEFVIDVGKLMLTYFKQMYDLIYNLANLIAGTLIQALRDAYKFVIELVNSLFTNISSLVRTLAEAINSIITTLKIALSEVFTKIGEVVVGIINAVAEGLRSALDSIFNGVRDVVYAIRDSVISVIESVKTAINTLADSLVKVLNKLIELVKTNPGNIQKIAGAIGSIAWDLGKMALGMFSSSRSRFSDIMEIINASDPSRIYAVADGIRYLAASVRELSSSMNNLNVNKLNVAVSRTQNSAPIQTGGSPGFFDSLKNKVSSFGSSIYSFFTGNNTSQNTSRVSSPQQNYSVNTARPQSSQGQVQTVSVNTKEMEKKLDMLITILTKQSTQTAQIKFGEKFVEEIKVQLGSLKDVSANVDNSRSRFISG
jgi:phage-related protein